MLKTTLLTILYLFFGLHFTAFAQNHPNIIRGFIIDDFSKAAPMLLPINSGNVAFQGTSMSIDQDVYGIRWNDSKINVTPGFTMALEFTARPNSTEAQSISGLVVSNLVNESLDIFQISQEDPSDTSPSISGGRDLRRTIKSPVNVFDGKKHSIVVRYQFMMYNKEDKAYLYKGSILIDAKTVPLGPQVYLSIADFELFEAKTNQWYGFPQLFIKNSVIHSWSFQVAKPGLVLQNSHFEKYSSEFTVDGNRFSSQNILKETKTNEFGPRFTVLELFPRNIRNQTYLQYLDYRGKDGLDLVNGTYSIPDEKIAFSLINYGTDNLDYSTNKDSRGSVQITDAIRYDGTPGKLVQFQNVSLYRNWELSSKKTVSGRLYVWESQPLLDEDEVKLINFCGKYDLQDDFYGTSPPNHNYSIINEICNEKDNLYCTQQNVWQHLISDIDYMAPATPDALTGGYEINKPALLSVPVPGSAIWDLGKLFSQTAANLYLTKSKNPELILKKRNNGAKVCDCKETKLIGWDLAKLDNFITGAGEFFNAADFYHVDRNNPILNSVTPATFTAINRTLPSHFLHPGKVTRTVIKRDGKIYVRTEGVGSTPNYYSNLVIGQLFFNLIDAHLAVDFKIISESKTLQSQIVNKPCGTVTAKPVIKKK